MYKKILIPVVLLLLFGCSIPENKDVSVEKVMDAITQSVTMPYMTEEYLDDPKTAERYGINSNSIDQGIVCRSTDKEYSDEVIIVEAAEKENVEELERAFAAEITGLTDAWAENDRETKKIDNNLLKTKGKYIILAVGNDTDKIEKIFDESV